MRFKRFRRLWFREWFDDITYLFLFFLFWFAIIEGEFLYVLIKLWYFVSMLMLIRGLRKILFIEKVWDIIIEFLSFNWLIRK